MPNTSDDTNLEYVELTNFSANIINLNMYSLKDKSWKIFYFWDYILPPWEPRQFFRPETKILLNNTDEELWLYDDSWFQIDYFTYASSIKDSSIITNHIYIPIFDNSNTDSNSWNIIYSWATDSSSWFIIDNSWSIIFSWSIDTSSWSQQTNSWITDYGSWITFGSWYISDNSWTLINDFLLSDTSSGFFISSWTINNITDTWARLEWIVFTWAYSLMISYWTWLFNSWSIVTGSGYIFENLFENTEYIYKLELFDFSWSITSTSTWSFTTLHIPIFANKLFYSDSDNNSFIDTFEIEFSKSITGSFVQDKFKVYSNTWWLSTNKIDLLSWIVKNFSIDNNILRLTIVEQDIEKCFLKINNSTSSELRLKSYSWIWIYDLFWFEIPSLTLTNSFDNYKNVFFKESSSFSWNTLCNYSSITNSWTWVIYNSGNVVSSWIGSSWIIKLEIPDIIISFQQPTYILLKDSYINEYICDKTKTWCRANFNLSNSFSWILSESKYFCKIEISNWITINSCNPDTIIFDYWIYNINFKILDKNDPTNYKSKPLILYNIFEPLIIPVPIITVQSWLDYNNKCKKSPCSVNFSWENSFLELSSPNYWCKWNFGYWSFSSWTQYKCNPWYVYYWYWSHGVFLDIFEIWNPANHKESYFYFVNEIKSTIWSKEIIPWVNYPPITIIDIQWVTDSKSRYLTWNVITCIWVQKCSINLTWENSYDPNWDKLIFDWDFGNWENSSQGNPKAINYLSGSYEISLKVTDKTWLYSTWSFFVRFINKLESDIQNSLKTKNISKKSINSKEDSNLFQEKEDFQSVFNSLLKEINDEDYFDKILDWFLDKINQEDIKMSKYSIKLQWKLGKNLYKVWNTIFCHGRNNCKVNLALDWKKINWFKYLWNFGNSYIFEWTNPKSVTYKFGKYLVSLSIFDKFDNLVMKNIINVSVSPIPKKITKPKTIKKKIINQKQLVVSLKNSKKTVLKDILLEQISKYKIILIFIFISIFTLFSIILTKKFFSKIERIGGE